MAAQLAPGRTVHPCIEQLMHDGTNRDGLPIGHLLILAHAHGREDLGGESRGTLS